MKNRSYLKPILPSLLIATVILAAPAFAQDAGGSSPPRCALLAADQSPVGALLEARLLERDTESWLEREEIEKVLAEQTLQAAFGAAGGVERAAIGRLLRADLLVLLRTGTEAKQPFAEVIVAETGGGLRLLAESVPLGEEPEEDAEQLSQLVARGLAKHREQVHSIFAVPPFVNRDLGFEHNHLKAAYAKLIERVLLAQTGVVVVELAEANALAEEYALASGPDRPTRRLPCYVLGEFRHEGRDDEQQVTIRLAVKRGSEQIVHVEESMSPSAGPAFLRQTAIELLNDDADSATLPAPRTEAAELAARSRIFLTLGNWAEALALQEACLLLDPDQPELRCDAVRAALELAHEKAGLDPADKILHSRRALEHCLVIFASGPPEAFAIALEAYRLRHHGLDLNSVINNQFCSDETCRRLAELVRMENDLAGKLRERRIEDSAWRSTRAVTTHDYVDFPQVHSAADIEFILAHQDQLDLQRDVYSAPYTVEGRQFILDLLKESRLNAQLRSAAEKKLAALDRSLSQTINTESGTADSSADSNDTDKLTFVPLLLHYTEDGTEHEITRMECFALENGSDLLWGGNAEYGSTPLLSYAGPEEGVQVVCSDIRAPSDVEWDGRNVWCVCNRRLWVIDPVEGKTWEVAREHGLPVRPPEAGRDEPAPSVDVVVPVGVGEAIVAGEVDQAWIAHVKLARDGDHEVRVIHEAKETPATDVQFGRFDDRNSAWQNPHLKCVPESGMMIPYRKADGTSSRRVVVYRRYERHRSGGFGVDRHPLVVDPSNMSVTVSQIEFPNEAVHNGISYYKHYREGGLPTQLLCAGAADSAPRVIVPELPEPCVLRTGVDGVQLIGERWWSLSPETGELIDKGRVPWKLIGYSSSNEDGDLILVGHAIGKGIWYSNHFGYVARCKEIGGGELMVSVKFDGTGISLRDAIHAHRDLPHAVPTTTSEVIADYPLRDEVLWNCSAELRFRDLGFSPDGSLIVTASDGRPSLRVWDRESGRLIKDLMNHTHAIGSVVFDRSGARFAASGGEDALFAWSTDKLELLHAQEGRGDPRASFDMLSFSWDGSLLASCRDGDVIVVYSTETWKEVARITSKEYWASRVLFTPDDEWLFATGVNRRSRLWNLKTSRPTGRFETVRELLAPLPDGRLLAVGGNLDRSLVAWDFRTNTPEVLWKTTPRNILAVSADARFLLGSSGRLPRHGQPGSFELTVWDVVAEKPLGATRTQADCKHWRLSPDGMEVAGVGQEGLLWRWDLTRTPAKDVVRRWTDRAGKLVAEAAFAGLGAEGVLLKRGDGETVTVPISGISAKDRAFLATVPTDELSPVGHTTSDPLRDDTGDWIEGIGQVIDPDRDCTITEKAGVLKIEIPGSLHDLSAEIGRMNAPRVLKKVTGDFKFRVNLDAEANLKDGLVPGRHPYQGVGILVMQDEDNYLRLEQAAIQRPSEDKPRYYVNFEFRRDGVIPPGGRFGYNGSDEGLQQIGLERRGSLFIPSYAPIGYGRQNVRGLRILFPGEVYVGVHAINASNQPFSPELHKFYLLEMD